MRLFLLLTILLLTGCSTGLITEPPSSSELISIKKNLLKEEDFVQPQKLSNERQASEFLRANLFAKNFNNHHACQRYEYLSKDETFALKDLAWIRSLKVCNYANLIYIKLWDLEKNKLPYWLQEEYINTSLEIARKLKLQKYEAFFLSESSKHKKIKKEKLSLVKESLKIARGSKDNKLIKTIEQRLHKLAPRLKKKIASAERFKVGRDYERVRDFDSARVYYRKIIRDPNVEINTKKMAWNRLRLSYKLQRQKPTYVHKTKKMVRFFRNKLKRFPKSGRIKKIWVDTSIKYARALWTQHRRDAGRTVLMGLLKYGVNSPEALSQIHWILGNMKAEERKFNEAIEQFEIASELDIKNKSLKEKITWALGWNYFLLGSYQKTAEYFSNFYKNQESHGFNLKLKFWTAKCYQIMKMNNKAEDIFEELTELDPYGYYGIVSHMELDLPIEPVEIEKRDDFHEDLTLEWLLAMDENLLATEYLKSIQKKFKTTEQITELLPLYERVGWYEGGIFKFFKLKPEVRVEALEDHVTSAFPVPYQDLAKKAADKFNIPTDLIYSITRQESAFNPVIRSWADAFGLMQLTPERAKELASRYKIAYRELEDLYDPEINMQLGAALLGELKRKFNNNFIHYVASYNASESVVKKWFKRNWEGDPLKFIEMIPYEETQGYVKLVFRNLVSYRRLLNKESFYLKPEMFTDI